MKPETIITCAVTGGADTVGKHPAIPVTPTEIASAAIDAARAGAAVAHIHVRDPDTGKGSMALHLYREVVERIRDSGVDVVINLTTGAGARYVPSADDPATGGPGTTLASPEERVAHILELRPELCSLDVATLNFGEHVFMNTPAHIRTMAKMIRDAGVKPELEVFDLGHVRLARALIADGVVGDHPFLQLCLGIPWGAPATPETMIAMRDGLPSGVTWSGFGIGSRQFPMVAQAALLEGHVRVGLEDNLYLERGVFAPDNAAMVAKAARIIRELGSEPATPKAARRILFG